jgi:hypothetical protein
MEACLAVEWLCGIHENPCCFRGLLPFPAKATSVIFNSRAGREVLVGVNRCVEVGDAVDAWFSLRDGKLLAQSSHPAVDRTA